MNASIFGSSVPSITASFDPLADTTSVPSTMDPPPFSAQSDVVAARCRHPGTKASLSKLLATNAQISNQTIFIVDLMLGIVLMIVFITSREP
jgi:hypothetical protein